MNMSCGPYFVLLIVSSISISHALECYVCKNQEGNKDKCLNTIKTCEQDQDTCLTEIVWGSTPYWNTGAKKQFYISKQCSSRKDCEKLRRSNMLDCTHIWYQDWKCTECCQGERCNYYVISGAETTSIHYNIIVLAVVTYLFRLWNV